MALVYVRWLAEDWGALSCGIPAACAVWEVVDACNGFWGFSSTCSCVHTVVTTAPASAGHPCKWWKSSQNVLCKVRMHASWMGSRGSADCYCWSGKGIASQRRSMQPHYAFKRPQLGSTHPIQVLDPFKLNSRSWMDNRIGCVIHPTCLAVLTLSETVLVCCPIVGSLLSQGRELLPPVPNKSHTSKSGLQ